MTLEIEKMLVISTAHVSPLTAGCLPKGPEDMTKSEEARMPEWWPIFAREEGWLFYVPSKDADDPRYQQAPFELIQAIRLAEDQGCSWLMLDRDGSRVDQLRTWEW